MSAHVRDPGYAARHFSASVALPNEIPGVKPAVLPVFIEYGYQPVYVDDAIQPKGRRRVAGRARRCVNLQLMYVLQRHTRRCLALMGLLIGKSKRSLQVFRERAEAPLLLLDCCWIIEALNSHIILRF